MAQFRYKLILVFSSDYAQKRHYMADITINIRIRRDIKRRLQFYACDKNVPLRNLADRILSEWLEKQEILVISPPQSLLIADLAPTDFASFPKESSQKTR